jgi:hypothetical protein
MKHPKVQYSAFGTEIKVWNESVSKYVRMDRKEFQVKLLGDPAW